MMEPQFNPYQSPMAGLHNESGLEGVAEPGRPAYKLYSVASAVLATFLGSPVAGGIVLAINYKRLGQSAAAIHAVVWSTVITATIIAAAMFLPDDLPVPNGALVVPQLIAMYYAAKSLQARDLDTHQRRGGRMASAWAAAGIGVLVGVVLAVLFLGVIFGIAMLSPE
jgi:hypothetical protein